MITKKQFEAAKYSYKELDKEKLEKYLLDLFEKEKNEVWDEERLKREIEQHAECFKLI